MSGSASCPVPKRSQRKHPSECVRAGHQSARSSRQSGRGEPSRGVAPAPRPQVPVGVPTCVLSVQVALRSETDDAGAFLASGGRRAYRTCRHADRASLSGGSGAHRVLHRLDWFPVQRREISWTQAWQRYLMSCRHPMACLCEPEKVLWAWLQLSSVQRIRRCDGPDIMIISAHALTAMVWFCLSIAQLKHRAAC